MLNKGQTAIEYTIIGLVIISIIVSGVSLATVAGVSVPKNTATTEDVNQAASRLKGKISSLEDRISTLEARISSLEKKVTGKAPAKLIVSSISAPPANTGEKTTISVTVLNTGGKEGTKDITLTVAGKEVGTQSVTVPAGGSRTISFTAKKEEAGDYQVKAGRQTATWSVTVGKKVRKWSEKPPIKIGTATSQSGKYERSGKSVLMGYKLAAQVINERLGGVLGRKVKLVNYDTESSPETCVRLYTKLIEDDKVDVCMGPYAGPMSRAVMPVVEKKEMPTLFTMVGDPSLFENKNREWSVTNYPAYSEIVGSILRFVKDKGYKRVTWVYEKTAFWTTLTKILKPKVREMGLKFATIVPFSKEVSSYTPIMRKAKRAGAEVFLWGGYYPDATGLTKAGDALDYHPDIWWGFTGAQFKKYYEKVGTLAENQFTPKLWSRKFKVSSLGITNQKFAELFKEKFGREPEYHSAYAFAGMDLLYKALKATAKRKGEIDKEFMMDYLRELETTTLIGKYDVYDSGPMKGFQKGLRMAIGQWQDKEIEIVAPPSLATAEPRLPD